jgi:glycine reductase complex component B subunit gamma
VLHYVNQFFGGIGGEEQAGLPPELRREPTGPGRLLETILGDDHSVEATLICGDNFFQEDTDAALQALHGALHEVKPDVVIAGPAFLSGRYGIACAEVAKAAQAAGVPALAGMNAENPAAPMFSSQAVIASTGPSPASMQPALEIMAHIAKKLVDSEELGPAAEEGYLPRGVRKIGYRDEPGYLRAVNMLVSKLNGETIQSEVPYQPLDKVESAPAIADLSKATIALASTGGLIRAGNPDKRPGGNSRNFARLDVAELRDLSPDDFDAYHNGYFNAIASDNPNYILPLSYARELEELGEIGKVHPTVYALAGVGTPVAECRRMGQEIGEDLARTGVDGCLLVAT